MNQETQQLTALPKYYSTRLDSGPARIILQSEFIKKFPNLIKEYDFKEYSISGYDKKVYISEPIQDLEILPGELLGTCLTVLYVRPRTLINLPYDFKAPFSGWLFIVLPFITFLEALSCLKKEVLCGRIVHLPQSSGYGKTRLCFEALKYFKSGIYCVFRQGNNGHPKTTPWMKSLIDEFSSSKTDSRSLFICAKFIYHALIQFQDINSEVIKRFEGEENSKFNFIETKLGGANQENWKAVINEIKNLPIKKLFLFVFDECHELLITPKNNTNGLSLYRSIRRIMFEIKDLNAVSVFVGTKSSLSDFVLIAHHDPSIRLREDDPDNAVEIPSYIFTQNIDSTLIEPQLLSYETCSTITKVKDTYICNPNNLKALAQKCGRPLWNSYDTYHDAFDIALYKLKCEKRLFALTSLILRTSSSVVPQDELAHKLVFSGMATLLRVDTEGSRCWIEYVPEPVLSNSARIILTDLQNLKKALNQYLSRLRLGVFNDTGNAGEFVARVILLRAMDLVLLKPHKYDEEIFNEPDVEIFNAENIFSTDCLSKAADFDQLLADIKEAGSQSYTLSAAPDRYESDSNSRIEENSDDSVELSKSVSSSSSIDNESFTSDESVSEIENIEVYESEKSEKSDQSNNLYLSPKIGVSTLREYLMMLSGRPLEELSQFGVSNEVLNGLISGNQFVQLECPLKINQAFLHQAFGRSVWFIAPGAYLIIPVLRKDNKMSCIAIQVKNYDTQTFPSSVQEISSKLLASPMPFMKFDSVGDFEEADPDDFIRIVIQFSDIKNNEKKSHHWIPFDQTKPDRKALWLCGMKAFAPLFFNEKGIIRDLNIILSGQRNFLEAFKYPEVELPTKLQTSLEGAKFLTNSARIMSNFDNLIPNDAILRENFDTNYEKYQKTMEKFLIPKFSKDYKNYCAFSANEKSQKFIELNDSFKNRPPAEMDLNKDSLEIKKMVAKARENCIKYAKILVTSKKRTLPTDNQNSTKKDKKE